MALTRLPIIGGTTSDKDAMIVTSEANQNLYLHDAGQGMQYLRSIPGLKLAATISGSSVRRLFSHKGILYGIIDDTFYELTLNTTTLVITETSRGTISTTSGNDLYIDANNTQILIADGSDGYVYTPSSTTFASVTDIDAIGFKSTIAIDGYAFILETDSQQVQSSALNDFTDYSAANNVFTLDNNDNTVTLSKLRGELYVFSDNSIEVFYNAANPFGFPFSKRLEVDIPIGTVAGRSVVATEDTIFFLDNSRRPSLMNGYAPTVIGTPSVNKEIAQLVTVSDAIGFNYTVSGQEFYHLTFPTENKTLIYHINTQTWLKSTNLVPDTTPGSPFQSVLGRNIINSHASHLGFNITGDFDSGELYVQSDIYFDYAGEELRRARTSKHVSVDGRPIFVRSFEVVIEPGQGLITGQGSSPLIGLETSRDGGFTFGAIQYRDAGQIGDYNNRIVWRNLGRAEEWVFRISCSEPINFVIKEAYAQIEVGKY